MTGKEEEGKKKATQHTAWESSITRAVAYAWLARVKGEKSIERARLLARDDDSLTADWLGILSSNHFGSYGGGGGPPMHYVGPAFAPNLFPRRRENSKYNFFLSFCVCVSI